SDLTHAARQQAEAWRVVLFGVLEQQLHAHADAQQGLLQAAQHVDQAECVQASHDRRRSRDPGQDHAVGGLDGVDVGTEYWIDAQPLQRAAHRADVGAARIDQDQAHQSTPLVLGSSAPSRRTAMRRARAKALKQASTLWWSLSPSTFRLRLSAAASHTERKKCSTSSVGISPTRSRLKLPSNTR